MLRLTQSALTVAAAGARLLNPRRPNSGTYDAHRRPVRALSAHAAPSASLTKCGAQLAGSTAHLPLFYSGIYCAGCYPACNPPTRKQHESKGERQNGNGCDRTKSGKPGWSNVSKHCLAMGTVGSILPIIAPDETKSCRHWQSNDGDGLNAEESLQLADRLTLALADGSAEDWALALRDRYDYQLDRWMSLPSLTSYVHAVDSESGERRQCMALQQTA